MIVSILVRVESESQSSFVLVSGLLLKIRAVACFPIRLNGFGLVIGLPGVRHSLDAVSPARVLIHQEVLFTFIA
jgi:hypothetical protein